MAQTSQIESTHEQPSGHNPDNPLMFRRNDPYLKWREVTQIVEDYSVQDLVERVRELEAKEADLKEEFGVEGPDTASVYRSDSDRPTHELMRTIGIWNGIQQDIRLYEAALQLNRTMVA